MKKFLENIRERLNVLTFTQIDEIVSVQVACLGNFDKATVYAKTGEFYLKQKNKDGINYFFNKAIHYLKMEYENADKLTLTEKIWTLINLSLCLEKAGNFLEAIRIYKKVLNMINKDEVYYYPLRAMISRTRAKQHRAKSRKAFLQAKNLFNQAYKQGIKRNSNSVLLEKWKESINEMHKLTELME